LLTHPGNLIGDAWYYVEDDTAHCFYLTCPRNVPRHQAWDIGHAVSSDLITWEIQELALTRGAPDSYDGDSLATGSVLHFQDRYWMAYTGNFATGSVVALAVSNDLYQWQKVPTNPVTRIDHRYYEVDSPDPVVAPYWKKPFIHWWDPFLFEHEGYVYHYVSARRPNGLLDERGTVGLARTQDMIAWEVLPPPEVAPVAFMLECPQLHRRESLYYLTFFSPRFSAAFLALHPAETGRMSSYAMISTGPFGPFRMVGSGAIVPHDYHVQPAAAQIVFWQDKAFLLGSIWDTGEDSICDPIPVAFTENGVKVIDHYS
jgi:beta-fructofuranosidase